MLAATILLFVFVVSIVVVIVRNGVGAMSWAMISELPSGGFYIGGEGGILNAIVGSLMVVGASAGLGLLVSVPVVFYLNVYLGGGSRLAAVARLGIDVLFGVPSIVYGAFAYTLMVAMGMQASLGGGIVVITILITPLFIRSLDQVARQMPSDILWATLSLGATRLQTIGVLVRQIMPGIATALLLSVGRAIGDAAAVMFTAGFSDSIPSGLGEPVATLPLAVFFQLSSPIPEVQQRAYAAAMVLTLIVLILSIGGRLIMNRFSKHTIQ